jgi:curved DNA-binding protein CbpA
MHGLPEHYEDLGVDSNATTEQIEQAYLKRSAELRASPSGDAPEELAEVETAYAVLRDPAKRAQYDAQVSHAEAKMESKYAELDKLLPRSRHHVRRFNKDSSGWLDAIWALFKWLG